MKVLTLVAQNILLVTVLASPAAALIAPERLVYDVTWTGMKAGTAVLEVTAQGDEFRVVNTINSTGFVSTFFRIDDRIETVMSPGGRPRYFGKKISEGNSRGRREATFDFGRLHADSKDLQNKTEKRVPITARTYDELSSIYFLRCCDLVPGQSLFFDIYDTKRLWTAEARVVKREDVVTPLGKFKTLMVTSQLRHNGVAGSIGNPTFWFTDDSRRIPVRIRTKLKAGEITLTLVGANAS